jgi:chromosomal replication initiation ATPase DnaA
MSKTATDADIEPVFRRLAERISAEHGLPAAAMLSRRRTKRIAFARAHFVAVLRWSTGLSYPEIGHLIGRDHRVIIAAVRSYEAALNGDRRVAAVRATPRLLGPSADYDQ